MSFVESSRFQAASCSARYRLAGRLWPAPAGCSTPAGIEVQSGRVPQPASGLLIDRLVDQLRRTGWSAQLEPRFVVNEPDRFDRKGSDPASSVFANSSAASREITHPAPAAPRTRP